jgi:hypothetical protein
MRRRLLKNSLGTALRTAGFAPSRPDRTPRPMSFYGLGSLSGADIRTALIESGALRPATGPVELLTPFRNVEGVHVLRVGRLRRPRVSQISVPRLA